MFIRIGGIPGVGKSTIISGLTKIATEHGLPTESVKGGDYLLRLAKVSSYQELRALPEEFRSSLRPEMYRLMYDDDRRTPDVIKLRDAHYSLVDPETGRIVIFPLLPEDGVQMLSMVMLKASPEVILARRRLEVNRNDRRLDLELIRREQEIEEETAVSQAATLGRGLVIIDNTEDNGLAVYREMVARALPDGNMRIVLEGALARSNSVGKEFQ